MGTHALLGARSGTGWHRATPDGTKRCHPTSCDAMRCRKGGALPRLVVCHWAEPARGGMIGAARPSQGMCARGPRAEGAGALAIRYGKTAALRVRRIPRPTSAAATTVSTRPVIVTASWNCAVCCVLQFDVAMSPVNSENGAADGDAGGDLGGGVGERRADRGSILRQTTEHVDRGDNADHAHRRAQHRTEDVHRVAVEISRFVLGDACPHANDGEHSKSARSSVVALDHGPHLVEQRGAVLRHGRPAGAGPDVQKLLVGQGEHHPP